WGKTCRSKTAKNGRAEAQTPAPGNTPPSATRRAKDCTAGAFEMSANKLPVADAAAFCAKQKEVCRETCPRQVTPRRIQQPIRLLQFALGARQLAGDPRIALAGRIRCAGERLEQRLDDVMRLVAVEQFQVQVAAGFVGETLEKLARQAKTKRT